MDQVGEATVDVSDTPAQPVTLLALPQELLALVLRSYAGSVFNMRPDGTVALPPLAVLCHAARSALLTHPELALRCAHIKRAAHTPKGLQKNVADTWEAQLGVFRPPTAPLRPTVLDLHTTDVHAPALCAALDAAASSGQPIRALSLRKCHSVAAAALASVFLHAPRLQALVCTAHVLVDEALHALGGLRELRLLCVAECTVNSDAFLSCLARLRSLRVLMLGGARLVRPALNASGEGILSLNPTLSTHERLLDGAAAAAPSPLIECGPHLALVEHTFLTAEDKNMLARVAPLAHTLDLCAPAATLKAGVARLKAILAGSALIACEGAGCIVDAALAATLSARCEGFHETALHHAAIEGDANAAQLLLQHGAMPDVKDAKGNTPLARATFWGRTSVCRLLMSKGADPHRRNHAAESPVYLAALRGHPDCLSLVLAADAAANGGGESGLGSCAAREYHDGYTPLHAAVISRSVPCMHLLIRAGFNASAQNKYGQSPLHIAASLGGMPVEGIELLVNAGCSLNLRDERGQTAERVARQRGHELTANLLAAHAPPRANREQSHAAASPRATPSAQTTAEAAAPSDEGGGAAKGGRGGRRRRYGRGAAARRAAQNAETQHE